MPSPRWPSLALDPTNDDNFGDDPDDECCDLCSLWPCECPDEAPDGYGPGEGMLGR